MRLAVLFVLLAAPAVAQPAAPSWRIAADGGIAGSAFTTMGALAVERSVGGYAAGARAGVVGGTTFLSPGTERTGFGEAFVSVTRRGRAVDLRGSAGIGAAIVDYYSGGEFFCDEPHDSPGLLPGCPDSVNSVEGVRGFALVSVGVDVHLTRTVSLGTEVRVAGMPGPANASSVGLGLRVRVP